MTVAYFDCFSGIAGDMILGALIDVGVAPSYLKKELKKLTLSGYSFDVNTVKKNHISATDVTITVTEKQHHRTLSDITTMINESSLKDEVKRLSKTIFLRLAQAESKIHGLSVDEIHFHEVGAVDSIIDIVGAVIGIQKLKMNKVFCSPLPLGTGFVRCAHGILPLPAPATSELLKEVPVYQTDAHHEMVTPTGAAIITTIAKKFGKMPLMKIQNIGYGAGKIKSEQPGLLRIYMGTLEKNRKITIDTRS
jgi:hypothetical protein